MKASAAEAYRGFLVGLALVILGLLAARISAGVAYVLELVALGIAAWLVGRRAAGTLSHLLGGLLALIASLAVTYMVLHGVGAPPTHAAIELRLGETTKVLNTWNVSVIGFYTTSVVKWGGRVYCAKPGYTFYVVRVRLVNTGSGEAETPLVTGELRVVRGGEESEIPSTPPYMNAIECNATGKALAITLARVFHPVPPGGTVLHDLVFQVPLEAKPVEVTIHVEHGSEVYVLHMNITSLGEANPSGG